VISTSHLVIWQVGVVGVADFNFKGFSNNNNDKFSILIDHLERVYGPEHPVIHYVAAVLPHQDPVIDNVKISDLRKEEIAAKVGAISTFYIPPKGLKAPNVDMISQLEGVPLEHTIANTGPNNYPGNKWQPGASIRPAYDQHERAAIAGLKDHIIPQGYQSLAVTKPMLNAMTKLALDPKELEIYKVDHSAFAASIPGLSNSEKAALESGEPWALRWAMRKAPESWKDMPLRKGGSALLYVATEHKAPHNDGGALLYVAADHKNPEHDAGALLYVAADHKALNNDAGALLYVAANHKASGNDEGALSYVAADHKVRGNDAAALLYVAADHKPPGNDAEALLYVAADHKTFSNDTGALLYVATDHKASENDAGALLYVAADHKAPCNDAGALLYVAADHKAPVNDTGVAANHKHPPNNGAPLLYTGAGRILPRNDAGALLYVNANLSVGA